MLKLCLYVTSVSSCLTFSLYNINIILVRNRTGSISVFMQQCLLIFFFWGCLIQELDLCISITCLTIILKITVRHYYACFVAHSNSCYPFIILVSIRLIYLHIRLLILFD